MVTTLNTTATSKKSDAPKGGVDPQFEALAYVAQVLMETGNLQLHKIQLDVKAQQADHSVMQRKVWELASEAKFSVLQTKVPIYGWNGPNGTIFASKPPASAHAHRTIVGWAKKTLSRTAIQKNEQNFQMKQAQRDNVMNQYNLMQNVANANNGRTSADVDYRQQTVSEYKQMWSIFGSIGQMIGQMRAM